ncbi:lipoyl(octanoyl) transferase LipB [Halorhodospira halophila]|uniref:Octanoyltransferase n=1 Tax=Halorhodospira halophila (strain DSM 244 / SL1) TaxID=349124 RepID=LIPB_HALHL|nr:lipoyl(octanoyl) transferase LipB [Halorhodospira halophila]A1WVS9.1 RecName: Full=Octanoyltransferase; AltName: Full=Lipoate-protein ligase B; AltName: Full=Lipoyl/octanoyl transferase; AltName: Full=Octanoyl-[acyl-carrier-protein]-protein N-octanoyltransferase [Halorhodospira halophila SL1]ABM61791.1 lipoate-protein ligase B [Halorhodospira halophila SL1]MBK1728880.1 octanoyltransferase [Halorhodospira halophila]
MPCALEHIHTRYLGEQPYEPTWTAMRTFTEERSSETRDELWLLQHPPVYTLGQAGRPEHILDTGETPVVHTDRGGQVTWHGPGQLVAYPLLDLRRWGLGVRTLVHALEQSVVSLLAAYGVPSHRREDAPGVYVDGAKVAALGIRVRRGCSYHGLSLNVCNDPAPFERIHPCGYAGLTTTRVHDLGITTPLDRLEVELGIYLLQAIDAASRASRHDRA